MIDSFSAFTARTGETDPLRALSSFVNYSKTELLKNGQLNQETEKEVNSGALNKAIEMGLTEAPTSEEEQTSAFNNLFGSKPSSDLYAIQARDYADRGDDDSAQKLRAYAALQSPSVKANFSSEEDYQSRLAAAKAEADPLFSEADAKRYAVRNGLAKVASFEENGRIRIETADDVGELDNKTLAEYASVNSQFVSPNHLFAIQDKFAPIEGLGKNKVQLEKAAEVQSAITSLIKTDPEFAKKMDEGTRTYELDNRTTGQKALDYGLFGASVLTGTILAKPIASILSPEAMPEMRSAQNAESIANDLSVNSELGRRYSKSQLKDAVQDMITIRSIDSLEYDEDNPASVARFLSNGTIALPAKNFVNKQVFEKIVGGLNASDTQKELLRSERASNLDAYGKIMLPQVIEAGNEDLIDVINEGKRAGKSEGQILEEVAASPKYSDSLNRIEDFVLSAVKAGTDLIPAASLLLPDIIGKPVKEFGYSINKKVSDEMAADATLAGIFGKDFGAGQKLLENIPQLIAQAALARVGGGAITGVGKGFGSTLTRLSPATAERMVSFFSRGSAEVAKKAVTELAEKFVPDAGDAAMYAVQGASSFGSTYTSIRSSLEAQTNADGTPKYSPEQIDSVATESGLISATINNLVTAGFNKLGGGAYAGAETLASGKGFSRRALQKYYDDVVAGVAELPSDVKQALSSRGAIPKFEEFAGEMTKSFIKPMAKGIFGEMAEEWIQTTAEEVVSAMAAGQDVDMVKINRQAGLGAAMGGVLGGFAKGVEMAETEFLRDPQYRQADFEEMILSRQSKTLRDAGAPLTADFLDQQLAAAKSKKQTIRQQFAEYTAERNQVEKDYLARQKEMGPLEPIPGPRITPLGLPGPELSAEQRERVDMLSRRHAALEKKIAEAEAAVPEDQRTDRQKTRLTNLREARDTAASGIRAAYDYKAPTVAESVPQFPYQMEGGTPASSTRAITGYIPPSLRGTSEGAFLERLSSEVSEADAMDDDAIINAMDEAGMEFGLPETNEDIDARHSSQLRKVLPASTVQRFAKNATNEQRAAFTSAVTESRAAYREHADQLRQLGIQRQSVVGLERKIAELESEPTEQKKRIAQGYRDQLAYVQRSIADSEARAAQLGNRVTESLGKIRDSVSNTKSYDQLVVAAMTMIDESASKVAQTRKAATAAGKSPEVVAQETAQAVEEESLAIAEAVGYNVAKEAAASLKKKRSNRKQSPAVTTAAKNRTETTKPNGQDQSQRQQGQGRQNVLTQKPSPETGAEPATQAVEEDFDTFLNKITALEADGTITSDQFDMIARIGETDTAAANAELARMISGEPVRGRIPGKAGDGRYGTEPAETGRFAEPSESGKYGGTKESGKYGQPKTETGRYASPEEGGQYGRLSPAEPSVLDIEIGKDDPDPITDDEINERAISNAIAEKLAEEKLAEALKLMRKSPSERKIREERNAAYRAALSDLLEGNESVEYTYNGKTETVTLLRDVNEMDSFLTEEDFYLFHDLLERGQVPRSITWLNERLSYKHSDYNKPFRLTLQREVEKRFPVKPHTPPEQLYSKADLKRAMDAAKFEHGGMVTPRMEDFLSDYRSGLIRQMGELMDRRSKSKGEARKAAQRELDSLSKRVQAFDNDLADLREFGSVRRASSADRAVAISSIIGRIKQAGEVIYKGVPVTLSKDGAAIGVHTNNPYDAASLIERGIPLFVPKADRAKLNKSIEINSKGYVTRVYLPEQTKPVTRTNARSQPLDIRFTAQENDPDFIAMVATLPTVPARHIKLLGDPYGTTVKSNELLTEDDFITPVVNTLNSGTGLIKAVEETYSLTDAEIEDFQSAVIANYTRNLREFSLAARIKEAALSGKVMPMMRRIFVDPNTKEITPSTKKFLQKMFPKAGTDDELLARYAQKLDAELSDAFTVGDSEGELSDLESEGALDKSGKVKVSPRWLKAKDGRIKPASFLTTFRDVRKRFADGWSRRSRMMTTPIVSEEGSEVLMSGAEQTAIEIKTALEAGFMGGDVTGELIDTMQPEQAAVEDERVFEASGNPEQDAQSIKLLVQKHGALIDNNPLTRAAFEKLARSFGLSEQTVKGATGIELLDLARGEYSVLKEKADAYLEEAISRQVAELEKTPTEQEQNFIDSRVAKIVSDELKRMAPDARAEASQDDAGMARRRDAAREVAMRELAQQSTRFQQKYELNNAFTRQQYEEKVKTEAARILEDDLSIYSADAKAAIMEDEKRIGVLRSRAEEQAAAIVAGWNRAGVTAQKERILAHVHAVAEFVNSARRRQTDIEAREASRAEYKAMTAARKQPLREVTMTPEGFKVNKPATGAQPVFGPSPTIPESRPIELSAGSVVTQAGGGRVSLPDGSRISRTTARIMREEYQRELTALRANPPSEQVSIEARDWKARESQLRRFIDRLDSMLATDKNYFREGKDLPTQFYSTADTSYDFTDNLISNQAQLEELGLEAGNNRSIFDALKKVRGRLQPVAELLLSRPDILSTVNIEIVTMPNTNWAGKYVPSSNTIAINRAKSNGRGISDVLAHELLHAGTHWAIRHPETAGAKALVSKLEAMRVKAQEQARKAGYTQARYTAGLASLDEFVTYTFTSPDFQRMLREVFEERGFIRRIFDAIASFFGAKNSDPVTGLIQDMTMLVGRANMRPYGTSLSEDIATNMDSELLMSRADGPEPTIPNDRRNSLRKAAIKEMTEGVNTATDYRFGEDRAAMARDYGMFPASMQREAMEQDLPTNAETAWRSEIRAMLDSTGVDTAALSARAERAALKANRGKKLTQEDLNDFNLGSIPDIFFFYGRYPFRDFVDGAGIVDVTSATPILSRGENFQAGLDSLRAALEPTLRTGTAAQKATAQKLIEAYIAEFDDRSLFSLAEEQPADTIRTVNDESLTRPMGVRSDMPDTVFVNPTKMAELTAGLSERDAQAITRKMISHEVAHLSGLQALTPTDISDVAASLTGADMWDIADQYYSDTIADSAARYAKIAEDRAAGTLTDDQIVHEFLRMQLEKFTSGFTTEQDLSFYRSNPNILQRVLRYMQAAVNKLRARITSPFDSQTAASLNRALRAYQQMNNGDIISSEDDAIAKIADGEVMFLYSAAVPTEYQARSKWDRLFKGEFPAAVKSLIDEGGARNMVAARQAASFEAKLRKWISSGKLKNTDLPLLRSALGGLPEISAETNRTLRAAYDAKLEANREKFNQSGKTQADRDEHDVANALANADFEKAKDDALIAADREIRDNMKRSRSMLPQDVVKEIDRWREAVDSNSSKLARDPYLPEPLRAAISNSLGVYTTQSYYAFTTKGWWDMLRKGGVQKVSNQEIDFDKIKDNALKQYTLDAERDIRNELRHSSLPKSVIDAKVRDGALPRAQQMFDEFIHDYEKNGAGLALLHSDPASVWKALLDGNASETSTLSVQADALKRNHSNLLARKNLPSFIREMLGEIKDPLEVAVRTLATVNTLSANQRFLTKLRELGLAEGWFIDIGASTETDPEAAKKDRLAAKALADQRGYVEMRRADSRVTHLNNIYGPEELRDAIERMFDKRNPESLDTADSLIRTAGRRMRNFAGSALGIKTLLSVGKHTRDFISDIAIMGTMQGHVINPFNIKRWRESFRSSFAGLETDDQLEQDIIKKIRLGVLDNDSNTTALRQMFRAFRDGDDDALNKIRESIFKSDDSSMLKKAEQGLRKLNPMESAAGLSNMLGAHLKVSLYEKELATLNRAYPERMVPNEDGDTENEIEAAHKVGRTTRTNTNLYPIIKSFSRSPAASLVAPFISFRAEMWRVMIDTPKLAREEIQTGNPVMMKRGYTRLAGWFSSLTVTPMIVAGFYQSAFALAFGDDEDKTPDALLGYFTPRTHEEVVRDSVLRSGLPDWQQGNTISFSFTGGKIRALDITFLNPLSMYVDPVLRSIEAVQLGESEKIPDIFGRWISTGMIGEQIAAGAVLDALQNKDDRGMPISNGADPGWKQLWDRLQYAGVQGYLPPAWTFGERLLSGEFGSSEAGTAEGRMSNRAETLAAEFLGARPRVHDPKVLLDRVLRHENALLRDVKTATGVAASPYPKGLNEIENAYDARERSLVHRAQVVRTASEEFAKMGVGIGEQLRIARETGLSKRAFINAINGYAEAPTLRVDDMRAIYEARTKADGPEAGAAALKLLADKMKKTGPLIPLNR